MNKVTNIERVSAWCSACLSGEKPCCLMIRKAIERWQTDMEREDLFFDERAFNRFVRFAREFKHYKGPKAGERFEPEDWQLFVMANVIGLRRNPACGNTPMPTYMSPGRTARPSWQPYSQPISS